MFGGCLDDEFALDSLRLMRMARRGVVTVLFSEAVLDELANAPTNVWDVFTSILKAYMTVIETTEEIKDLQRSYFRAKVLTEKWALDAYHVAAATFAEADALVS